MDADTRADVCAGTYGGDFAFDILQEGFLASDEEWVLELSVIFLWFQQTTLLNVYNLPETI